jgi:predicted mannosyl-3-phosphoglycerate phosphatase (HAD superfamily)
MHAPSIYTDVDGTLLGDDGQLAFSVSTLREAAERGRLVLASSRTLEELAVFAAAWGVDADLIAENGALIGRRAPIAGLRPESLAGADWWVLPLGAPRRVLWQLLHEVAARDGVRVDVVDKWPTAQWTAATGQSPQEAARAQRRRASVLVAHLPPPLASHLQAAGFDVAPGGRWTCITRGAGKGAALQVHAARWGRLADAIAVGDAANDCSMLAAVPNALIVRRADGSVDPALAALSPPARVLAVAGARAWPDVLDYLPPPRSR